MNQFLPEIMRTNNEENEQLSKELALLRHFNNSLKTEIEHLQKELALYRQLNEGLCWAICEIKQKYYQGAAPHKHPGLPNFSHKKEDAYTKTATK